MKNQLSIQQIAASLEDIEELRLKLQAMASSISGLDRRIGSMRKEWNSLRPRIADVDGLDNDIPIYSAESGKLRGPDEVSNTGNAQSNANDQTMLIEETINAEEPDPVWANFAASELEETFQDADSQGIQILETDCRSTLCRITLQSDDSAVGNDKISHMEHLIPLLPWNSEVWFKLKDSGEVVGYLAREGYSLPNSITEFNR